MRRAPLLLLPPAALLALFFAVPMAATLQAAASASPWEWIFGSPFVRSRLGVALLQAVLSVALTLAVALPLAWFHHRRALPWTRLHLALHAAPFVLPVFVVVFGLQALLGARGVLGMDVLGTIGPLGAVVLAHTYYNYGFAARVLHASLERRPWRLEEAAMVLGAPPRAAMVRVTASLLLPSVAGVAVLVFLFTFASFGVVLLMGQGSVDTLETLLYENLGGGFPALDRAAALGVLQLAINALVLSGYLALQARTAPLARDPQRSPPQASKRQRVLAWVLVGVAMLPALAVLAGGFRVGGAWSVEPWRILLDPGDPRHLAGFRLESAVGLSLFYVLCATLGALALTLVLAYGLRSLGGAWRRAAEAASALPLGASSLLLGFGFLLAFGAHSILDLRGSLALVVVAHTLVAFPFVARIVLPSLEQLDPRMTEAAAMLGATPLEAVRRIHLPLLRGPLLAAAGMAAAISLGDFGASLLLMSPDTRSVSVWIAHHGGLGSFDPLLRAQSVALAGLLMVMAAAAYIVVERFRGSETT
jgi:thiamine transport system permease protein